jgi:hypothetical protein
MTVVLDRIDLFADVLGARRGSGQSGEQTRYQARQAAPAALGTSK